MQVQQQSEQRTRAPSADGCRHPFLRCTTDLDPERRPAFRCECGALVPCRDKFENRLWFEGRIAAMARAIRADDLEGADALAASLHGVRL